MEKGGKSGNPIGVKSLAVPSVQDLVSATVPLSTVPSRYVSPQPLDPPLLLPSDAQLQVPVIDIHLLLSGDPSELKRLHSACHHWGFFQAVKHGVNPSLVERFKSEVKDLFNLPAEEKRKYWKTPELSQGFGQKLVVSEEQQLDWADIFTIPTNPPSLRHPGLFTSLPQSFRCFPNWS